ncbi:MAG: glycosyltransferase [Pelagibacterales bacterium]|nr:glycosyltransferase [Pelagibacterales bacterium]
MLNRKIHVLQVVGTMNYGGAEVMLMDIFRNISKDVKFSFLVNFKVRVGITKGDFDNEILSKESQIKHIGTQWGLGPIAYIREFKKKYNELGKPEVVHIHLNAKNGVIALAAKLAGAKKIIAHSHANIKFRGPLSRILLSSLEMQFQKLLIFIFCTDYWGASEEANASLYYTKLLIKSKVINNAVDTKKFLDVTHEEVKQFRQSLNISDGTLLFGTIGRIVKHKNVGFIIDLLKEYRKLNSEFIFLFAGRVDDKEYFLEIQSKVKEYQLDDKVIYLGNRGDVPIILNAMDVIISPALKEGFGLVAVEAQASGVPCLLYKGFPPSVDMGIGLIIILDHFDKEIWVSYLDKIKNDKSKNKKLIRQAIKQKGFDIKQNTSIIEGLYLN